MSLLERFDPPARMTDFDDIPGQRQQWSEAISGWIDESIQSELETFREFGIEQECQFFNETKLDPKGLRAEQPIIWNGFPKTLREAYGLEKAYRVADRLFSLAGPRPGLPTSSPFYYGEVWEGLVYRPQDEYCEWFVERHPETDKIIRITFTSEPPEYWQALHGDALPGVVSPEFKYRFTGSCCYRTSSTEIEA